MLKKITPIALAALMLFSSCTQYHSTYSEINVNNLSGKELFRGIFFMSGYFASKIPMYSDLSKEISSLSNEQKTDLEREENKIISLVEDKYGNIFDDFKQKILSHDHTIIADAIKEYSEKLYIVLKEIPEIKEFVDKSDIENIEKEVVDANGNIDNAKLQKKVKEYENLLKNNVLNNGGAQGRCITLIAVYAIYVVTVLHGAVFVFSVAFMMVSAAAALAVTITGYKTKGSPPPEELIGGSNNGMKMEVLVDQIANI